MLAERISRLRDFGLVVGFTGVLGVVLADPEMSRAARRSWRGSCSRASVRSAGPRQVRALRERDIAVAGLTAAQFLCGGVPLLPFEHGETHWHAPSLLASLAFLIVDGRVLVYLGFSVALGRWPSTRVYAWTFLVLRSRS